MERGGERGLLPCCRHTVLNLSEPFQPLRVLLQQGLVHVALALPLSQKVVELCALFILSLRLCASTRTWHVGRGWWNLCVAIPVMNKERAQFELVFESCHIICLPKITVSCR